MNVPITIIIDGDAQVGFKWCVVPRVGEHIVIGTRRQLAEVIDVLYHGEADPRIDLICEWVVQ